MSALVLMMFHVMAAILISGVVLLYIRPALNRMIGALCSNGEDVDFWQRYTVVMMVITPIILMLMFNDGDSFMHYEDADELRSNLLLILLGQFLGLAVVGQTLWRATRFVIGMDQSQSTHELNVKQAQAK